MKKFFENMFGFLNGELNDKPKDEKTQGKKILPNDENSNNSDSKAMKQIKEFNSIIVNPDGPKIYCMTIIGQIEGHYILSQENKTTKYERIIPQLVSIEEDPEIGGVLILLNTVGGDIEAGLAIAELIAGMKKPTVSMVLGGSHSIGVPLAVSAKKSFIAKSASMILHPVRMSGTVLGVPQAFEHFQRMQKRITNFVVENSKITAEEFMRLVRNTEELVMDIGSVLSGKQAVEAGLIDYEGNLSDAMSCLFEMINQNKK